MPEEVNQAQRAVNRQLAAYKKLVKAIYALTSEPKVRAVLDEFEPLLFNHMTLVLDRYFVGSSRPWLRRFFAEVRARFVQEAA